MIHSVNDAPCFYMLNVKALNGTPVFEIRDDVDIFSADAIFASLSAAVNGADRFVVSFEHCHYCDSSGIAHIVHLVRNGRRFAIVALGQIRRTLELTQIHTLVPVVSSLSEAVERLKQ